VEAALQIALDFVEGRITPQEFEQKLYTDPQFEALLKDDSLTWSDTFIKSNPFDYLAWLRYDSLDGILDAQGAVELFLLRKQIPFQRTSVHADFYVLLLEAQPKWLRVDMSFLQKRVLPEAGNLKPKALREWLSNKLFELFRYYKKPPKWLQSPAWPITENGPMYFLGQIKLKDCELFHNEAAAYLFIEPATGETRTVIQAY